MGSLLGVVGKVWTFVLNPPAELTNALMDYGVKGGKCVIDASVDFAKVAVEIIKTGVF
jgi:hypothetical protein